MGQQIKLWWKVAFCGQDLGGGANQSTSLALLLPVSFAAAADLTGRGVGVSDGDALTLLTTEKQQIKARWGEIDMPESRQPEVWIVV